MNETEVTIHAEFPLSGTLTLPKLEKKSYPAVLIISGSGKGNRDGNLRNMNLNVYKELAEFLTMNGCITLRYDKRGTHQSEGNYYKTGLNDLINDATDAVNFLRSHNQVDSEKVFILGHSEGALLTPAVYHKTRVCGLILLAGAFQPSKTITQLQADQLYNEMKNAPGIKGLFFRLLNIPAKAKKQNEKLLKRIIDSDQAVMRVKGIRINAKWMRETLAFDVSKYLRGLTCPVLVVSGEKDVQVPPKDAEKIADNIQGKAEWYIVDDMNHILRKFAGNHTMLNLSKEYKSQINQPIDNELLNIIKTWLIKYGAIKDC